MIRLSENKFKVFLIMCVIKERIGIKKETKGFRYFPDSFKLGAGTSAYQIEGGWNADGKGVSIWDTFAHQFPEKISDHSTGDIAADSYYLYKDDIAALKNFGAQFYRFSFSWSRILSTGEISSKNPFGIAYYHQLIDDLLENDIEPIATMHHSDLPQHLQNLGGWTNQLIIEYFEQFANLLFLEYGSKIKTWITVNEPSLNCYYGYGIGRIAPGIHASGVGEYLCIHNYILAHARTYHLYKQKYYEGHKGKIGISLDIIYGFPKNSTNERDIIAAERSNQFGLGLCANPIFSSQGDYPEIVRQIIDKNSMEEGRSRSRLPKFTSEMVDYVKGSADFLGLNYYKSWLVEPGNPKNLSRPSYAYDQLIATSYDKSWPMGANDLYSVPKGFYELLLWIKNEYNNVEVFVTENGWSDDGVMEDDDRVSYLNDHYEAILNAIDDGCNITGHTIWSLIDNFEWIAGYTVKFGLFRVDSRNGNLTRVEKKSVGYVRDVFQARRIKF